MNGWQKGITDRQHEAALRYHCGEPMRSIARAMGLSRDKNVQDLLFRYEARGGKVTRRKAPYKRKERPNAARDAALVARTPFQPMESLAKSLGISRARAEQILVEHERKTGVAITRFHESKSAVLQSRKDAKAAQKRKESERIAAVRLEFLERIASYRQQGMVAEDVCATEGVETKWPAQMVNSWLHEWERRTGRKRYPGQAGRRPRRFDQRKREER